MRSEEFRQLRMAAGWSVRGAANELGVTPSTIQRWEAGATIPSEAADQVRAAAGMPSRLASAHVLGHLTAVLSYVIYGYTPEEFRTNVGHATRAGMGKLVTRAMQEQPERFAEVQGDVQELFAGIEEFPGLMDDERAAEFWRGYYTRRKMLEDRDVAQRTAEWLREQFACLDVAPGAIVSAKLVAPEKLERFLCGDALPSPVEVNWIADAIAKQLDETGRRSPELRRALTAAADLQWLGGEGGHPGYRDSEQQQRRQSGS